MLVLKIILCVVAIVAFLVAHIIYMDNYGELSPASVVLGIVGTISALGFCTLLIITSWNVFTIAEILLFATACSLVLFIDEEPWILCPILVIITIISFIVCYIVYTGNFDEGIPEVTTTRYELISANDETKISGEITGRIRYVHGSISEKDVYKFYYVLEDGGVKQGSIPVDDTVIYFLEGNEIPYLEEIITTEYSWNKNKSPAVRCNEKITKEYKLYIPDGSITEEFTFDLD